MKKTNCIKKMMSGWFKPSKKNQEKDKSSASIAKIRLKAALSNDKKAINLDFLPKMEAELCAVLEKYMEISNDDISCDLKNVDGEETLDLSINFNRKKRA